MSSLPHPCTGGSEQERIAFITPQLNRAGAQRVVELLVRALAAQGVACTVYVAAEARTAYSVEFEDAAAKVVHLGKAGARHPVSALKLWRALRREKPTAVHYDASPLNVWLMLALWTGPARRIAVWHRDEAEDKWAIGRRRWLTRAGLWIAGRTFSKHVVVSPAITEGVARHLAVAPTELEVIDNGIDTIRFRAKPGDRSSIRAELGLPEDAILIAILARLRPEKGHVILLRALQCVDQRAQLLVVGDGPERGRILHEVGALGLDGRVHLLGERADPERLLAASDIAAQPTLLEGFGLSIVEALSTGIPVVCSDLPVTRHYLQHDMHALLVPPGDVRTLSQALSRLIASPEERERIGAAGAKLVRHRFDERDMTTRHIRLLIGEHSAASRARP